MSKAHRVLVLTGTEDPMWLFLLDSCSTEERKQIILFPTDQPEIAECSCNPFKEEVVFRIGKDVIYGDELRSIWWRRIALPDFSHFSKELQEYCKNEYLAFFQGLEHVLGKVLWVSRPSSIELAKDKIYQLQLAKELGFKTVDTLFTNSPTSALEFSRCADTIYKPIRSPRVPIRAEKPPTAFTSLLGEKHFANIEGLWSCPGIFQRFVKKAADIRVTVFGETVFAVLIDSQREEFTQIDFRVGARHLPHFQHKLPEETNILCIKLVAKLGLKFGAIDLALLEDGSYVFFEINPNGQWGWLEEKTGLPMRRALLDLLLFD